MHRLIAGVGLTLSCMLSQQSFGQVSSPKPYPGDLHDHNRAIAFGSALMVTEGGSDPRNWKQVDVMFSCGGSTKPSDPTGPANPGSGSGSSPGSGPSSGTSGSSSFSAGCAAGVHYVTHYDFVECPDGRAYIVRSGEGVFVTSPTEGSFFGWSEGVACAGSSKPTPVPAPGLMDENRPLDFDQITRIAR